MARFYARGRERNALMHRNKSTFPPIGSSLFMRARPVESSRANSRCRHQRTNLQLFQMDWGIDKIARRGANRGNKRLFGLTYH
jgi:hypothetical protein